MRHVSLPAECAEPAAPSRVAVVDDHPIARYGMERVVASCPRFEIVALVGSASELDLPRDRPDIVILDLYEGSCRISSAQIAELAENCAVLVMSASVRPADVMMAIRSGANGYVAKSASNEALIEAMDAVTAGGGLYLSSQLADVIHVETTSGSAGAGAPVVLAPREKEALALIAQGFTQAQAARRMAVSPATVDTYIKRIRAKLGPGNKADLTRRAIELGQLDVAGVPGL